MAGVAAQAASVPDRKLGELLWELAKLADRTPGSCGHEKAK
eukprot:CAMPEP_0170637810 /NCGR_PEP_ID=MMETSP0224-20130122/38640_1 /TAXON_ID=285029 /ORGANISM="Togula jolla, Strain CCCM 725" /LENGTH=40 /DNA_ID= /DNA_START= /DNA_END= /DNA_ORIENTATION=